MGVFVFLQTITADFVHVTGSSYWTAALEDGSRSRVVMSRTTDAGWRRSVLREELWPRTSWVASVWRQWEKSCDRGPAEWLQYDVNERRV